MTTNFDAATRNLTAEENGEETVVAAAELLERVQAMVPDALKQFDYRSAATGFGIALTWYSLPDWNRSRASRFLMKSGLIAAQVSGVLADSMAPKHVDFDRSLDQVGSQLDFKRVDSVLDADDCCGEICGDAADSEVADAAVRKTRLIGQTVLLGAAGRLVKGGLARFGIGEAEPLSDTELNAAKGLGVAAAIGVTALGVSESLIYRFGKRRQQRGRKFAFTLPAVVIATVVALGEFAVDNVDKLNAIYLEKHPENGGGCGGACDCSGGGCGGGGACDGKGGCGSGSCDGHGGHEDASSDSTPDTMVAPE